MKIKLGAPKLVCGDGINDVDYVVKKRETIGYEDGKQMKEESL